MHQGTLHLNETLSGFDNGCVQCSREEDSKCLLLYSLLKHINELNIFFTKKKNFGKIELTLEEQREKERKRERSV